MTFARRPNGLSPSALLALYVLLVILPLGLATLSTDREEAFSRELCIGIGMAAFAMLLLQFVLSGRFEFLSGRSGIDLTMRFHQLLARTLLAFVVIHPVLLVVPRAQHDFGAALQQLQRLFFEPRLSSGVLALAIIIILVATGIWRRRMPVKYEVWRITHGLGAVAAAGFTTHHVFKVGSYAEYTSVRLFWIGLVGAAFGSFFYIYVVKPILLWRMPYRVERNEKIGPDIWEVSLKPARDRPLAFEAGQFAWVTFGRFPSPSFDHPFSIASSPAEGPSIRFLIKESGDFTRQIGLIQAGAPAYLDAPHGNFTLAGRTGDSICLIAGGIGIAPIMSILRHLYLTKDTRPIALLFAARSEADLVHRDEIEDMTRHIDLIVTYILESPPDGWTGRVGKIDCATVRAAVRCADPKKCLSFICGPAAMMLAVERHLVTIGLTGRQIIYEQFVYD